MVDWGKKWGKFGAEALDINCYDLAQKLDEIIGYHKRIREEQRKWEKCGVVRRKTTTTT